MEINANFHFWLISRFPSLFFRHTVASLSPIKTRDDWRDSFFVDKHESEGKMQIRQDNDVKKSGKLVGSVRQFGSRWIEEPKSAFLYGRRWNYATMRSASLNFLRITWRPRTRRPRNYFSEWLHRDSTYQSLPLNSRRLNGMNLKNKRDIPSHKKSLKKNLKPTFCRRRRPGCHQKEFHSAEELQSGWIIIEMKTREIFILIKNS